MQKILIILGTLMVFNTIYSQSNQFPLAPTETDDKNVVKFFYKTLFDASHQDTCFYYRDIPMSKIRKYRKNLTQNLSYDEICRLVDSAVFFEEGGISSFIQINFNQNKRIYFEVSGDLLEAIEIGYIGLSDGRELYNLIEGGKSGEYFSLLGTVYDSGGSVNIRAERNHQSKVVGILKNDSILLYVPSDKDWWMVMSITSGNPKPMGYIPRYKIKPYSKMSDRLKEKADKVYNSH